MSARALWACAGKESLLLVRDPHGLLLLFVMPAVFILVMSLALQEQFASAGADGYIDVLIFDRDGTEASDLLVKRLARHPALNLVEVDAAGSTGVKQHLETEDSAFAVRIEEGFSGALRDRDGVPTDKLRVSVSPDAERPREHVLLGALRETLAKLQIEEFIRRVAPSRHFDADDLDSGPKVEYLYQEGKGTGPPTSVQQNVPAWLVFGVFFVVVPLSNTMIRERQLGMELRLRTTPVSQATILAGKLLPYFLVNQFQVAIMLAIGVFFVPALGGDPLSLAGVPKTALVVMAVSLSLAALGYALLIAVVSRTTEQATMLGGAGNIILAAIGGIMVPEFIMPDILQALTQISPMAWGLEGLLIPLLHGGGGVDVAPHALVLSVFGTGAMGLAWMMQRRQKRY